MYMYKMGMSNVHTCTCTCTCDITCSGPNMRLRSVLKLTSAQWPHAKMAGYRVREEEEISHFKSDTPSLYAHTHTQSVHVYTCSQPRELWFSDTHMYSGSLVGRAPESCLLRTCSLQSFSWWHAIKA